MVNKFGISSVFVAGIIAQWVSWRFRLPSIVLLLTTGFVMGPVTGFLKPDEVFGDILFPFVSLSVAVILFEGGLSLRLSGLKANASVIRNLITIGALVSWGITAWGCYALFQLSLPLAVLLGSILIVTGPTVIIPLLKQMHLKPNLASVLRWEGIVIDPIAATLAVLIYEFIVSGGGQDPLSIVLVVLGGTAVIGLTLGGLSALFMIFILKRHWIPSFLQESVTLMVVIFVYVCSDLLQAESGLLTVTIMGIVLANQRVVTIKHIVTFKENLTVMLLSTLFIVLAARISLEELQVFMHVKTLLFLGLILFVARPLSVFISCIGSQLSIKERLFVACMAPRGIVAAAVVSLFGLRLLEEGYEQASLLVPITFMVMMVTVVIYGFLGVFLARIWNLSPSRKGILIAGAHEWARKLALIFQQLQIPVTLVDTNKDNVLLAREAALEAIHGSILSKTVIDEVQIRSIRLFLGLTASDKTNLLALREYADMLGDLSVFRLFPKDQGRDLLMDSQKGAYLFKKGLSFSLLEARFSAGASLKVFLLDEKKNYAALMVQYPQALPLFLIRGSNRVLVFYDEGQITARQGDRLILLINQ